MFKRLVNECKIELTLRPQGAMLIKSGLAQISGVDMAWVRVFRNGQDEVYLPGSSLKGTIRSHAERIARTMNEHAACDPFAGHRDKDKPHSCGTALELYQKREKKTELTMREAYRLSCPICKLFGNTQMMGRLATEDAYVKEGTNPPSPQQRDGVGIDRFTGGAARGAKFELEVITEGEFHTTLHLTNFELWQLGLLGFVLHDLKDGLVRFGSGKSRGLGKVAATVDTIQLQYVGSPTRLAENGRVHLLGVGALYDRAPEEYGIQSDDHLQVDANGIRIVEPAIPGLRQTAEFTFDDFPWQQLAEKWLAFVNNFTDALADFR